MAKRLRAARRIGRMRGAGDAAGGSPFSPQLEGSVICRSEHFPTTQWDVLGAARSGSDSRRRQALDFLGKRYMKPVCAFLERQGRDEEEARELAQSFFAACTEKETFAEVIRTRGRFRTFLLACLRNHISNLHRDAHAQKRFPAGGLTSIEQAPVEQRIRLEQRREDTPEQWSQRVRREPARRKGRTLGRGSTPL